MRFFIVFVLALSATKVVAKDLPFVGVVEWNFAQDDLKILKNWQVKLTPDQQSECVGFTDFSEPVDARSADHSGKVLSQLLIGQPISPNWNLLKQADPLARFIALKFDNFTANPRGFFKCLAKLHSQGMVAISMSVGLGSDAELQKIVADMFREFLKENPNLIFLLAAGNNGIEIGQSPEAPQILCKDRIPNLFCVTFRHTTVAHEEQGQALGTSPSTLDEKYQATSHNPRGDKNDPVFVPGTYINDTINYATPIRSSSFATPKLARLVLQLKRENESVTMDVIRQKYMKKIWGFTRDYKMIEVWDF